ncbi:MAG: hypothetical protein ABSH16_04555 [Sedimentisphaerales bacterium]
MSRKEPGNPPIKAFEGRPFDRLPSTLLRTKQDFAGQALRLRSPDKLGLSSPSGFAALRRDKAGDGLTTPPHACAGATAMMAGLNIRRQLNVETTARNGPITLSRQYNWPEHR